MKDIDAIFEIFRASEIIIHPDESVLEKQNFWTSHFLKQELFSMSTRENKLNKNIGKVVVSYNKSLLQIYFCFVQNPKVNTGMHNIFFSLYFRLVKLLRFLSMQTWKD